MKRAQNSITSNRSTNWIPVRRGRTFCSSACGGGCTYSSYKSAVGLGLKVAKSLGKGWTVRMNENLGWHVSVLSPCKRIKIHIDTSRCKSINTTFTAYLNEANSTCFVGGRWHAYGRTAKTAMKNVVRAAKDDCKRIQAIVEGL